MTNATRRTSWLTLLAILALAFNLRPVAVSVGPVLKQIAADTSMDGGVAGLLTSLPALCFAAFGSVAPALAGRIGPHRTVALALVALITGQLARTWVSNQWAFLALSILALAGMALANVLLPSLVRLHFPNRIGLATSLYSLTLTLGITLASMGTVPLAQALGGWRAAFTAGTGLALAALLCWLPMLRVRFTRPTPATRGTTITLASVARTRMGWAMAVLFGCQSAQAYTIFGWLPTVYQDAGMDQLGAGVMLGIATGVGIIPAFAVPAYTQRQSRPVGLFLTIMACLVAGYVGLLLAPMRLPWLWALLLALGTSSFPLILALLGLRARTAAGTAALSGFTQSVGYLIAATGPLVVGILYGANPGRWTLPLSIQLAVAVPMTLAGVVVCRSDWAIEDEVSRVRASRRSGG